MISFRVVSSWEKVNVHIRCLEFVCFVFRACCAGCCLYTIRRSFPRNTMYTKPHTCYTFPIEGFTERFRCITNCEVITLFISRNLLCIFLLLLWNINLNMHLYLINIRWNYPKQFSQGFRSLIKIRVLISNCTVIPLVIPCSC